MSTSLVGIAWSAPPKRPRTGQRVSPTWSRTARHPEAPAGEQPVEADRAVEHELRARRGQERLHAAEAEADRHEARRARALGERGAGRVGVGLDLREQRLLDVGHVLPVAVALAGARGPAEVVDRDRVMAGLGEALGELDVEAVEPADVGQDDHAGAAGPLGRLGQRGGERACRRPT